MLRGFIGGQPQLSFAAVIPNGIDRVLSYIPRRKIGDKYYTFVIKLFQGEPLTEASLAYA